jgi:hypothetical protein
MGKWTGTTLVAAVLALSLLGCEKRDSDSGEAGPGTAGQLAEKAEKALQTATEVAVQQKDKLVAASREQLDKLEQQFGQWAGEAGIADEQAKEKLASLEEEFRSALTRARSALETASGAGVEAWKEAKPGLESAVTAVQSAYDAFVAQIKSAARAEEAKQADPRIEE